MNRADGNTAGEPRLWVGAPMWAHSAWLGRYLPAQGVDPLRAYATWCTAVEGNTTFYATPAASTVDRWAEALRAGDSTAGDAVPPGSDTRFRFCFKLPKTITHDRRLRNIDAELDAFLGAVAPLGPWLGPILVQLPASFAPSDTEALVAFLDRWPASVPAAVEVRHPAFVPGGASERPLNDALATRGVNRVLIDTRPVFSGPCVTPGEIEAFKAKPRIGVRPVATGAHPIVRFIGLTDPVACEVAWQPWVTKVVEWLDQGLEPYVFIHTPDNVESLPLNRRFYAQVRSVRPALAPLPVAIEADEQLDLFG